MKFVILLIAAVIALFPAGAFAEGPTATVQVIGEASMPDGNIVSAKSRAVADGISSAVRRAVMDLIPKPVLTRTFSEINRLVLSGAEGFVQDYKVTGEASAGKSYHVLMEATVSTARILDLLTQNKVYTKSDRPLTVLLLIAEQNISDDFPRYWWGGKPSPPSVAGTALAGAMTRDGVSIITPDPGVSTPPPASPALPGPDMSDTEAIAFGVRFQADVVVVGTAAAERAPNALGSALKSFKGTLSVRALRTDTGQVIAESTENTLTANADDATGGQSALSAVGLKAAGILGSRILAAGEEPPAQKKTAATILVESGYNLMHLVAFRKALAEMPGVKNLQTKGMTATATTLALDLDGSPQDLARALILKSFEGFGVRIADVGADTLRLSLTAN